MSIPNIARSNSPLDHPPVRFSHRPFYAETLSLLRGVRDHDFESLQWLCDDDFGIVDIDPSGQTRVIRNKAEWSQWFHELFSTTEALGADTESVEDRHLLDLQVSAPIGARACRARQEELESA